MTDTGNTKPLLGRRRFLARAGGLLAGSCLTAAIAPKALAQPYFASTSSQLGDYDFLFTRVKFHCRQRVGDRWNHFPGADKNLLNELRRVTRCGIKQPENCQNGRPRFGEEEQFNAVVTLDDRDGLRGNPFIFMTAEGEYSLSDREKENLKEFISAGGFLMADDCVWGRDGDFFYQSTCQILRELFGQNSVGLIPNDHEIMQNVHDMRSIGLPLCLGVNRGPTGLFVGDRVAAFISSTDLHCGWIVPGRRHVGPGGIHGYEEAVAMGVNVLVYAMSH